jgi:hydrogenase-1 operon protein HyaF
MGTALPLLHEIRHALTLLLTRGEESTIDLASIPLGRADEDLLFGLLGDGEVKAELRTLGRSFIRETAISGVWIVEHFNPEGQSIARLVEISSIPSILKSQPQDMQNSLEALQTHLARLSPPQGDGAG